MLFLSYDKLIDPLLKGLRIFVADFAELKPGQLALDVCCGTGAQVMEYGHLGAIATGIDLSPEMLRIAERNRARNKRSNTSFQLADATNLPFTDHSFDIASVSFGLHDKTSSIRDKVISEMTRVIKPGGSLVLVDFEVPLPENMWGLIARSIEFLAGGSHYAGFKNYVRNGGLDNILKTHKIREERREQLLNRLVTAIRARPNSSCFH
jgi:ubiquinone/menaquinone biosynthesis C-methylase UbiE